MQGTTAQTSIADILEKQGALTPERVKQVKLAEVQTGKTQEEIITEQRLVNETSLTKARATLYNIPYVDILAEPANPEALSTLPQEVAQRFQVFPLRADKQAKLLDLAMADPMNLTAIEFIEQKTGFRVRAYASEPSSISEVISSKYSSNLSQEVTAALKEVGQDEKTRTFDVTTTQSIGLIRQEKTSEIVSHILEFAVKGGASDIHIEPMERTTRVRYRIDGILQEKLTIPRELHDPLISRLKILSGMKIDEKRIAQDGRFTFKNNEALVDLRASVIPTAWGENFVLRLLLRSGGIPDLPELGLRGRALKNLGEAILKPHGIIIICGPTGSGKTTTLYSIIQRINTPKVNIMTLEDPIEYKIPGVNQVQINPVAGLTFASGLRSFLRQDPNIILVQEIRDKETMELAIQASLTGHLVFATLHTNDAAGALPRLLDMGAETFLLASSMTAVVGQRVLRKIDMTQKEKYTPDAKVLEDIKNTLGSLMPPGEISLYRGKPTAENNNSGFKGRVGIYEVMPVTDTISRLILERAPASKLEAQARLEGMMSIKQDGYLKALEGITTIEEVLRVARE